MSDFVESAKNFVNAAVSRTSWEAQKQLRVRGKQGEIEKLVAQRQQLLNELTQVVMNLYQEGALTDMQLSRLCASILELDHDARNRETQLQEIKNETYPVDQFAPGPTMNYAPPPISPAPSSPPPTYAANANPQPAPSAQSPCPHCGNLLRPN